MIGELSIGGVFVSAAMVTGCVACFLLFFVKRLLTSLDIYRLFWHRYLVDLALFAILWAGVALATQSA